MSALWGYNKCVIVLEEKIRQTHFIIIDSNRRNNLTPSTDVAGLFPYFTKIAFYITKLAQGPLSILSLLDLGKL